VAALGLAAEMDVMLYRREWRRKVAHGICRKTLCQEKYLKWLRVSDTAERSQVNQRVPQQLHPIVPLLDTFKAEQQALELVFPRKGAFDGLCCTNPPVGLDT
jgi:hypothetical protein